MCRVAHSGSENSKFRDCHAITEGEYYGVTIAESRVSAVLHDLFRPKGCWRGEGIVMVREGESVQSLRNPSFWGAAPGRGPCGKSERESVMDK